MSAGAIKAGEAFVRIWANDAEARAALKTLQGQVKRFADSVSSMGRQITVVGAAMTAPFAASARTIAGFADTMSTVKGVTGAVGAEFDTLNATAKRLGETTSFTAREAAEGMLALARAGFSAEENMAALPHTLNLARAGALGLGEASEIMSNTSRSFGLAADQSERVGDALAKASNISNTDVQNMGESMKYVAQSGKMTGQSLERVSAAMAVMANRGLKGSMSGTSMARVLSELTRSANRAFLKREYNVDTADAQGDLRDVLDIMRDLSAATRGMGNADKLALFDELFGARGKQGAMALAENIGEWERFSAAIENAAGTAASVAAEMDNNLGGSFRLMMSAVEGVQIALGEATQGTLRDWMTGIQSAAQSVSAFVAANQDFVTGVMKIGATLLGAGAAVFAFGKGAAVIGGVIGMLSKYGGGLRALQDRITGVAEAQKAKAAADKALDAAAAAHVAAQSKQEAAQKAQENAYARSEAAAYKAATARQKLDQAERDSAAAAAQAAQKRIAAAEAEAKAVAVAQQATLARKNMLYGRQRLAKDPNAVHGLSNLPYRDMQPALEANAAAAQIDAARAKAELTARTRELTAAEGAAANAGQAVAVARRGVEKADTAAAAAARTLQQAQQGVTQSQVMTAGAAGKLNAALYGATEAQDALNAATARAKAPVTDFANTMRNALSAPINLSGAASKAIHGVGQAFANARNHAAAFGAAAVQAMGSPKFAAAAGSVAMLAGSVSMLAGDSTLGKIAQWVATVAGMGMAASGAVAGVQALKTAMAGMSAGAQAATAAFLKLAAAIGVAFAAYKAGQWINHKISGFDPERINKDAKQFARAAEDRAGGDKLKEQQILLKRIGELRRKEADQGVDVFGGFRLVNPFGDNKALNAEINALEAELEGVEEQYRAQTQSAQEAKKAADEAAETERIEANRQAVKDLAAAWDDVLKTLADVNKQRADRARDKRFDADVEADPYAARGQASGRFDEAKAVEAEIVKCLHELEAERQRLVESGADTDTLTGLQATLAATLKEYEAAVAETDVWERFHERADDAVTKTRDSLQRLAEDAKQLDLDVAARQDDARFKNLLQTDWTAAAAEVAQAMARVNADWLATGQRIAELQTKAEGGDINAQRDLEKALERRKELASERGNLEGRQKEVDSEQKSGERRFDRVREVMGGEAKYRAKEDWQEAAEQNPRIANAALDAFIADLESQLADTGALAEQARAAQDYAGASAYAEQAKSLQDQLSELRGMKGQADERATVTGDFSARAMEAMMRGGGGQSLEKQQLETQQSMNERLGKLVDLYAAPTVVAVD